MRTCKVSKENPKASEIMTNSIWNDLSLWWAFVISVVTVCASIWIGTVLGSIRRRRPDHEQEGSLGTIISATLGLLAFMLAFTFGIASERFQVRRQLLLDEVNVIGTTYLRAGLLKEPHRSEVRQLLRKYVELRVELTKTGGKERVQAVESAVRQSHELQKQMWSHANAMAMADRSSEIDALFIDSLNELINALTSRFTVFQYRIPPTIWFALGFITVLAMGTVGYQLGLSDTKAIKIAIVLALTFSAVVFLIIDLDDPNQGYLQVGQQPLFELHQQMQSPEQSGDH